MVELIDLTVRDGQQSLLATRMRTEDVVRIVEVLDRAGFYALEVWGGATFDAPLRFLMEDPWERLKKVREVARRTKLMMLLRGMNLVGYRHYPRDVVEKFVEYAHRDGIDVFRIFDALNDLDNLELPVKKAKEVGAEVQVCMVYTTSPVHTTDYYIKLAEEIAHRFEPEWVTIKDMSGILRPYVAQELVSRLKKELGLKVDVHSHATAGFAPMTLLKAIEAGADAVDVTVSSLSLFTSHTPAETLVEALRGTPYETRIDTRALYEASRLVWEIRKRYREYDYALRNPPVDIRVLEHQIPGGMLSNLLAQLRELGAEDKLPQVLEEVTRVREDLGWPPLVTPLSQIVGTQAVLNVMSGRYRALLKEVVDYIKGKYGKPPAPIKRELIELAEKHPPPKAAEEITLDRAMREVPREYVEKFEDYITYALFPENALKFFEYRRSQRLIQALMKS
ncbi:MAG: pyruvate carboxylase subunit B [Crenarchaeota archaeon]|nr:pyruvate carboxylase subunit B [Thermoproteota archaeon]